MSYSIEQLYQDIKSETLEDFTEKLLKISREDKVNNFINHLIYELADQDEKTYLERIQELCYYEKDVSTLIIRGEQPDIQITGFIPDGIELKLKNSCKD